MWSRSRAVRNTSVRLIALVVTAGWVAVPVTSWSADTAPPPPPGGPAPNFALTTQQNDRLWLTQLRGRAVVLAFGCASCGACPGLVSGLADLARGLRDAPGRRVFFALVTVDPTRDTPAVLREFGRAHALRAPAWILLTEDRAGQVDVVARRYGVEIRRAGERVDADCGVTLIDAAGAIRARYASASLAALGRDLRALLGLPPSP